MKPVYRGCLFIGLAFHFGCNQNPAHQNHQGHFPDAGITSDHYRPPVFGNDLRVEKVKALEPAISRLVEEYRIARHIPGIAWGVVVDDKLVLASATGLANIEQQRPATAGSAFRIASMTKSFTAMAILKLRDEGKLSLSDPAERYVPEMSRLEYLTADSKPVTIVNLLTMTAGFPEDNPWGDRQLDEPDRMLKDLVAGGLSLSNPVSQNFEYSNTGYALLGLVIDVVSGMPYQDYIREQILLPLGMENSYWELDSVPEDLLVQGYRWEDEQWEPEPMLHDGSFGAMGGLITTLEDFSKYVGFHLSAWPSRSDPESGPVGRSTLRDMQIPRVCQLDPGATGWDLEPCAQMTGYGYGLRITEDCHGLKLVGHGGALPGFGSNYVFFPEYGIGLLAFCNLTYTSPWPLLQIIRTLFESGDLEKRVLPVSDILSRRQQEISELIRHWDPGLEQRILAENFFLDRSRDTRMSEIREILEQAGTILGTGPVSPENQLRGTFDLRTEKGNIEIYFTLTPEKEPKVQQLDVTFHPSGSQ